MSRLKLLTLVSALLIGLLSAVPAFAQSNTVSVSDLRLAPGHGLLPDRRQSTVRPKKPMRRLK